jgi:hypothetical protein
LLSDVLFVFAGRLRWLFQHSIDTAAGNAELPALDDWVSANVPFGLGSSAPALGSAPGLLSTQFPETEGEVEHIRTALYAKSEGIE